MSTLDHRALRDAFGTFMTGVTVVTTIAEDDTPIGFTANSFTSVSLEPPLLLVCISKSSQNLDVFTRTDAFAVNVLSQEQRAVSQTFASQVDDRFSSVTWRRGPHGSPVFDDVCAWFDCATHRTVDAGDHFVLIGEVRAFESFRRSGLGYVRGVYFTPEAQERAVTAAAAAGVVEIGAIIANRGRVLLIESVDGRLRVPSMPIDTRTRGESQLTRLLAGFGLPAAPGFIYSVYHDRVSGARHIVYRCTAGADEPLEGAFHDLNDITIERVAAAPERNMLMRFAEESRVGNFGVYFGHERGGEVHHSGQESSS